MGLEMSQVSVEHVGAAIDVLGVTALVVLLWLR